MSGGAQYILVASALLAAAIGASVAAARLRLPVLLVFLAVGMAVGSDGSGWIPFSDYELAGQVGTLALALILFDGGLSARTHELREVLAPALRLAIGGTIITAIVTGVVATSLFHLPALHGLLLGAILASTDTAAVFGILRASSLRRRLAAVLEGEAGFNDPVAVLLVIGFISWIKAPAYGIPEMLGLFAREALVGAACGLLVGRVASRVLQRVRLPTAGLYPVASLAAAGVAFGSAESLHGSGFLAVYLAGLALAHQPIQSAQAIASFHQGLAWLAQITLFLTLGLLVSPGQLGAAAGDAVVLALTLVFVARPLAVRLVTIGDGFTRAERIVLSWAGLRGAVPAVLATFPVTAGISGSTRFFNDVFFVVVISTALQGTTLEPLARRLGLTTSEPPLPRPLADYGTRRSLGAELIEYPVSGGDSIVGRRVGDLGLPEQAALSVIVRDDEAIPAHESTQIRAGDTLHFVIREEAAARIPEFLRRWRDASWTPPGAPGPSEPAGLITRPWTAADGDPSDPELVNGALVVDVLRLRGDSNAALVQLENGTHAVTGASLAFGSGALLRRYANRRMAASESVPEQRWWREVAAALER
ncbi:MAG TPA: potassium/proton antiporter [Thermoleophilaceae bacterium]|jgi:cell volume regulation protein A|nr:potassium/proton antiporter [Thermoleophilaceae bacterium]